MTIEEIKKRSLPHFQALGVRRAALFGSFARGEETPMSDLDFLVELPDGFDLFDFIDFKHRLEDEFHRRVDLVEYDVIKPRIKDSILRDQVSIL